MDDPWVAYMVDHAVFSFGRTVQNKYDERDDKGKRRHSLEWCLGERPTIRTADLAGVRGIRVRSK